MRKKRITVVSAGIVAAGVLTAAIVETAPASAAPMRTCGEGDHGRTVTVNANHVNVRTGPSVDYRVIGQQNKGDHLCVMGGHRGERNPNAYWLVFEYHDQDGWINDEFLDPGWD